MFYQRSEISSVVIAIVVFACVVGLANFCSCSGAIPIPVDTIGDKCSEKGAERCNGEVSEVCTGRQWYPRWDCSEITVDGEAYPQRCVRGRCKR
jgi:hypothetical protein